jgi:hypothetical protein
MKTNKYIIIFVLIMVLLFFLFTYDFFIYKEDFELNLLNINISSTYTDDTVVTGRILDSQELLQDISSTPTFWYALDSIKITYDKTKTVEPSISFKNNNNYTINNVYYDINAYINNLLTNVVRIDFVFNPEKLVNTSFTAVITKVNQDGTPYTDGADFDYEIKKNLDFIINGIDSINVKSIRFSDITEPCIRKLKIYKKNFVFSLKNNTIILNINERTFNNSDTLPVYSLDYINKNNSAIMNSDTCYLINLLLAAIVSFDIKTKPGYVILPKPVILPSLAEYAENPPITAFLPNTTIRTNG